MGSGIAQKPGKHWTRSKERVGAITWEAMSSAGGLVHFYSALAIANAQRSNDMFVLAEMG